MSTRTLHENLNTSYIGDLPPKTVPARVTISPLVSRVGQYNLGDECS